MVEWSLERIRSYVHDCVAIDFRSLVVFRIGLALVLLTDLLLRARHLVAHYTDHGVVPRTYLLNPYRWSLHALSGTMAWQVFLFVVAALCAVCFLLNYWPRVAIVISWVLLVSLHNRNGLVLFGGDFLLRLMLFWSMFFPWDRIGWEQKELESPVAVALLAQVSIMYCFAWLLKTGDAWINGGAVSQALALDQLVRPVAAGLLQFPTGLEVVTYAVLFLELCGAVMVLLRGVARVVVLVALVVMHVGMGAVMHLGLFPWIVLVALVPFIPSLVWNGERSRSDRVEHGSVAVASIVAIVLAYIVVWNVAGLPSVSFAVSGDARIPANVLRIDQHWALFAPYPMTTDGWFAMTVSNDVERWPPGVARSRPRDLFDAYGSQRWRKFMMRMRDRPRFVSSYLAFVCDRYVGRGTVSLRFMHDGGGEEAVGHRACSRGTRGKNL